MRVLVALLVVGAFLWLLRGLDLAAIADALRRARWWPIAVATALNFGHLALRAVRWQLMLQQVEPIGFGRMLRYTIANYAASTILPARMGELLRVWLLRRREGVPASTATATAIGEKVLEAAALAVVVVPVPWLLRDLPGWIGGALIGLVVVGLGGVGLCALLAYWARRHPDRARGARAPLLVRFAAGVDVLGQPADLALTIVLSIAAWIVDVCQILLVLAAVGVYVPWTGALLVLLTLNLAAAIPAAPAQLGAFEIGAVVALEALGVPRPEAVAFALVFHAVQVVPLALVGIAEVRLVLEVRRSGIDETAPATG